MSKTLCFICLALAASCVPAQAQLAGSVISGLTDQVESFWTELFNGSAFNTGFLTSLHGSNDQEHMLQIPETEVNFLQTLLPGSAASDISDTVNQGLLKGMELSDQLEAEFCKPAYLQKGVKNPTECEGPEYTFTISGGYCTLDKDTKSVTCVKPEVTLEKTAGTCTLKYTSPTTAFDKECKATKVFGDVESGVLASWPGADFDLSQIYNMTESSMKSDGFSLSKWLDSFTGEETPASASANATVDSSDVADGPVASVGDGL
ncbi:hypothetical protein ABBQ38_015276 [Trebouxia sp. C0009 RCD-2024]